ncbi:MAG: TonB-dependent receptor [Gammaproteobacteria bacterium]|nr:TonB-dependent receptor [Gammaproteobacteria bacterium]
MNEQTGVREVQLSNPAQLEAVTPAFAAMAALMCTCAAAGEPSGTDSAEGVSPEYTVIEEVVVTGSRIMRDPVNEPTAILQIDAAGLERAGLTNLGDALQNLPITGSAPNSQFNVPGNSGFPQDGSGIGAGSVQLSLRNLGAKRTLVLVDGRRWVAGASASGVPGTVDLNSLPDNMIGRIEILQDGASAVYGSDAIGGVVNIITDAGFAGFEFDAQTGGHLKDNDGESTAIGLKWGVGDGDTHAVLSASWRDELGVETADRKRSAFPNPDATSCDVPGSYCSSFTPQGRFIFGPNLAGGASVTLNNGVLNDGGANIPVFDPANPGAGDFHVFTSADRFNYNGPTYNYLRTPNERTNLFGSVRHAIGRSTELFATVSYTHRSSATKAAPEPLCLGAGCGNPINDNFVISAENPYNPFGVDLSVAAGTMAFFGRRPLESGGRLFFQDTHTYFATIGVAGEFERRGRPLYWEAYGSHGENQGFQTKRNSHNAAKLQIAMGHPAVCEAVPGCVPFNFFGGQGPDGSGSITREMLDFVTYTQRDESRQTLANFAVNVSGDLFRLPAGEVGFATGVEYRDHAGWFHPDPIAERGETAGIPAGRTEGGFDVMEFYGELRLPLVDNLDRYWELNVAARRSDYSTSGAEATYKVSSLFQPVDSLALRGSFSTGFRAPGIGELFGGAAREDFTFLDPCSDVLGRFGSLGGGRDAAQPAGVVANCASLGVPVDFVQSNPQLSAVSAGNAALSAETSESFTLGVVWSADFDSRWIARLSASVDYYGVEIADAVQGRSPADVLAACVDTLDPAFCDLAPRTSNGALDVIDNQLQNIGGIEAAGFDVQVVYDAPAWSFGQISVTFNGTLLDDYTERTRNVDGTESVMERTGSHTNETFQRAFPELRWTAAVDWLKDRWDGSLALRWTDSLTLGGGGKVDAALFTDVRLAYTPDLLNASWTATLGFNNVFDEDPPLCFPCGVIGMSTVAHDLPGRIGYVRVAYRR